MSLRETGADVLEPLELGFGFCRLVVAAPSEAPYPDAAGRHYREGRHQISAAGQAHFAALGRPVDIIQVNGSVEVAPLLNLSHWIVDLVDTGNTLEGERAGGAGDDPAMRRDSGGQPRLAEAETGRVFDIMSGWKAGR